MKEETIIAGLSCSQVLDLLESLVAGDLESGLRDRVVAHTSECDNCARCSAEHTEMIQRLHAELREMPEMGQDIDERLRHRLNSGLP